MSVAASFRVASGSRRRHLRRLAGGVGVAGRRWRCGFVRVASPGHLRCLAGGRGAEPKVVDAVRDCVDAVHDEVLESAEQRARRGLVEVLAGGREVVDAVRDRVYAVLESADRGRAEVLTGGDDGPYARRPVLVDVGEGAPVGAFVQLGVCSRPGGDGGGDRLNAAGGGDRGCSGAGGGRSNATGGGAAEGGYSCLTGGDADADGADHPLTAREPDSTPAFDGGVGLAPGLPGDLGGGTLALVGSGGSTRGARPGGEGGGRGRCGVASAAASGGVRSASGVRSGSGDAPRD